MKRNVSTPVILAFPATENRSYDALGRRESRLERMNRLRCVADEANQPSDDQLAKMRARLLRMIIENERVRNDGPRAS